MSKIVNYQVLGEVVIIGNLKRTTRSPANGIGYCVGSGHP